MRGPSEQSRGDPIGRRGAGRWSWRGILRTPARRARDRRRGARPRWARTGPRAGTAGGPRPRSGGPGRWGRARPHPGDQTTTESPARSSASTNAGSSPGATIQSQAIDSAGNADGRSTSETTAGPGLQGVGDLRRGPGPVPRGRAGPPGSRPRHRRPTRGPARGDIRAGRPRARSRPGASPGPGGWARRRTTRGGAWWSPGRATPVTPASRTAAGTSGIAIHQPGQDRQVRRPGQDQREVEVDVAHRAERLVQRRSRQGHQPRPDRSGLAGTGGQEEDRRRDDQPAEPGRLEQPPPSPPRPGSPGCRPSRTPHGGASRGSRRRSRRRPGGGTSGPPARRRRLATSPLGESPGRVRPRSTPPSTRAGRNRTTCGRIENARAIRRADAPRPTRPGQPCAIRRAATARPGPCQSRWAVRL